MNGPIRRMALGLFVAMTLLVGMVSWVQVIDSARYRDDPRNARVVAARIGRERGTIITADGVVVAQSLPNPADRTVFRRSYPQGDLYAHVVGYSTVLFGNTGLEASRSSDLVSDRDSTISGVLNAMLGGDLRPRGLRLTIDNDLQTIAAEALGSQRGAVAAVDPRTGGILAMVSFPSFDPNRLIGSDAAAAGEALEGNPAQPLLNRAAQTTYNPGSTFKTVITAAALETGHANAATTFPDPDEVDLPGSSATISNFSGGSCNNGIEVTLATGFTLSCNTTFAQLGMQLGVETVVEQAEAFGFNAELEADIPSIGSVIPSVADFDGDLAALAQSSIGERDVRATPLQMALVAGAVANGGLVMAPYVVGEVFNADGEVVDVTEPRILHTAMSPATATALAELMEQVVTGGTGTRAGVPGVRIGGKTGTAEVPGRPPHSWFIGFGAVDAEPDQPQIAIAVVVESSDSTGNDATGGTVAAPIAQQVLAEFFSG
ncbi:MAG: penicillin-binding protein 2 [Acidimicrobiia bacterium]|nr:penicillin-binding protein 2 [Acidimicrobiia bacterium]